MNTEVNGLYYFTSFVRGKKPGQGTGFDINDDDLLKMEQCRELVVASAIFGSERCSLIVFAMIAFNLSAHKFDTVAQGIMI